jgi:hypothetical protein
MRTSTIDERFSEFLENPTADRYWAVRELILERAEYNPYSVRWQQIAEAFDAGDFPRVRQLGDEMAAWGCLSPRLHFFSGIAAAELGDMQRADAERQATQACLSGLLATGEGVPERPFVATYLWDEYDLLRALQVVPQGQSLVDTGAARCDVITDDQGDEYWFDVSDLLDRQQPDLGCGVAAEAVRMLLRPA